MKTSLIIHLRIIAFILLYLLVEVSVFAQEKKDSIPIREEEQDWYFIKQVNDTLQIDLEPIWLFPRISFESEKERREYLIAQRRVYKVYPYAVLAAERLAAVNNVLDSLSNKRAKKTYLKRAQKFMQEEFTDTLKNFTRSEGRILFKLIYRQTGYTTFELIKEYRSGWNAFWYNTAAAVYNLTMKQTYNPIEDKEDYYIEDVLQRAFTNGRLEEQPPAIPIELQQIYEHWE